MTFRMALVSSAFKPNCGQTTSNIQGIRPALARVAVLYNPEERNKTFEYKEVLELADSMNLTLHAFEANSNRIFKGTNPRDLPIEQPTTFAPLINLKSAKALGRDMPVHLQQIADEVIE